MLLCRVTFKALNNYYDKVIVKKCGKRIFTLMCHWKPENKKGDCQRIFVYGIEKRSPLTSILWRQLDICMVAECYQKVSWRLLLRGTFKTNHWLLLYQFLQQSNPDHPYGYSNMRYVASLVSGVGIFCVGAGLSVYHGITGYALVI